MSDFEKASSVEPKGDGTYRVEVPDGWQQGRGAFGGLVLGTLVRAMRATEAEPLRRLRSLTGDLCGPALAGEAAVRTEVLRRGKNLTNLDARLVASGEVVARASAVYATARNVPPTRINSVSIADPSGREGRISLPSYNDVPRLEIAGFAPVFAKHFEYRAIDFPFSGGAEPVARGYVRFASAPSAIDEPAAIALLDAWWPALFTMETTPRVVATVSFTAEILADLATLDPKEPLAYAARVVSERNGFFVELRELWSGDTLVAMNQQTFAILA